MSSMAAPPAGRTEPLLAPIAGPAHLVALGSTLALLVLAPLAVGTVHRNAMFAVAFMAVIAVFAMGVATWGVGRSFRGARYTWPLALLVLLPALQIIPLPLGLRGLLDPVGNELLQNAPPPPLTTFALSLDPSITQIEILRAAVALFVFLVCLNLSSGRRGHGPLIMKAIAGAAVFGVFVAVGHPLLNFDRIYDHFGKGGSPMLVGPFINPNHTAQFFELGAFAAIACAFFTHDRAVRVGWMGAGVLCGAGALLTLSRGSLIGLVVGALVVVLLLPRRSEDNEHTRRRGGSRWVWPFALGVGGLTAGLAVALGALPILDEIGRTRVGSPGEKTEVWLDSIKVLRAHPAGIGRGAFDRVYPAYRTMPGATQQNFVENEPLQMLLDLGWLGFAGLLGALAYVAWLVRRRRLRDAAEAAMLGALFALLAHNVFDFGLETMGIRLPFVAVAGVLVGRLLGGRSRSSAAPSRTWLPIAVASMGIVLGAVALWKARSFDELLGQSRGASRVQVAIEAARTHPTDYFFPLTQAMTEPVREGNKSPRLAALNRATRLCPNCANVHRATGGALWELGRVSQALGEYRLAMDLDVGSAGQVLNELYKRGATHDQVASIRATTAQVALAVAGVLVHRQAKGGAPRQALAHAQERKADGFELGLLRVYLAFNEHDNNEATDEVRKLLNSNARDGRALYLQSVILDRQGDTKKALETAIEASGYNPDDLALARQVVYLATRLEVWGDLERGLDGLKRALQVAGGSVAEAYVLSAQAHSKRGNLPRAMRDYQAAINLEPNNLGTWYSLASAAEQGGFYTQAEEAYKGVLRLQPEHAESKAGLVRIEALRQRTRLDAVIGGGR